MNEKEKELLAKKYKNGMIVAAIFVAIGLVFFFINIMQGNSFYSFFAMVFILSSLWSGWSVFKKYQKEILEKEK